MAEPENTLSAVDLVMAWTDEDRRNFSTFMAGYRPDAVVVFEKRRLSYRLDKGPSDPMHAHTYGMRCPVGGCRWPSPEG